MEESLSARMLARSLVLAASVLLSTGAYAVSAQPGQASDQVIKLNNDGVNALKVNNYQAAVQALEKAMEIDRTYTLARENLAIAYNNWGISMHGNPAKALEYFHKSLYWGPSNTTAVQNLEVTIQALNKDPRSFKDRLALGKQAQNAGDFAGAIVEYREALKLKDDPKLRISLGDVLRVSGGVFKAREQVDQAIDQYKQAAKAPGLDLSEQVKAWTSLGQCYQSKKDYPNATAAYRQAITLDPTNNETLQSNRAVWDEAVRSDPTASANHIGLGEAYKFLGDFGQAAAEYRQALILEPGNQLANKLLGTLDQAKKFYERDRHINTGVDLQNRKLFTQAIQEYSAALAMDPRNADILANIGSAYQAMEDYANAVTFYNKALAILPSHPSATEGLKASKELQAEKQLKETADAASQAFKLKNFDEALKKYQELVRINPKDAANHFNVGATYQALKQLDPAIAEYRTAISLDAKNKTYQEALKKALQEKADPIIDQATKKHGDKDYPAAIALYQQALALVPDNLKVEYNLASAYFAREQYPEALKLYEELVKKDPKGQVDDLWFVGQIQEHFGRGPEALTTFERYINLSQNRGQFAALAKARVDALRKDPNDTIKIKSEKEIAQLKEADDAYNLGVKLSQEKKYEEAIAAYKKAMSIRPLEPAYPAALGALFQQKGDFDGAITWYLSAADLAKKAVKPDKKLIDELLAAVKNATALKANPIVEEALKKQTAGDNAGAIELYKKALDLVPDNAKLWTNLGTAYQLLDNFADARAAFEKAVALSPKEEANCWYAIAAIDEHFGQGNAAIEHYRKYVTGMPTGPFVNQANQRLAVLSKNPNNTQKLPTQSEIKSAKTAQEAFDEGLKLQQAGNHKDAIPLYEKAIQAKPSEPAFWYALGTAFQNLKDFDSAITKYQKAMELDPKNDQYKKTLLGAQELKAEPIVDQAVQKYNDGDYAAAAALYGQVINIVPNNAKMHTSRAAALQAADDFAGARAEYQKAFDIDPKGEKENLYFLGALAENFGQGQQALDLFRRYQTENPKGQFLSYARQRTDVLSKNVNATVKIPTSGERKNAEQLQQLFDAGLKAQKDGNYQDAIGKYAQCIQLSPDANYHYARGTAYQAAGQIDEAINDYKVALQKDPKNKDFEKMLQTAYDLKAAPIVDDAVKKQTSGDVASAIEGYRKALEIVPNNARLHTNLAIALQASDNFAGAREEYQKALNMDKKGESENWYFLAVLDENFGKGPQALQEYQTYLREAPRGAYVALAQQRIKDLQANPNSTQKLTTQAEQEKIAATSAAYDEGIKLQQENKLDEAIAKYQEAIKNNPELAPVWFALGTAYQNQNNVDKAIESYEKAVSLNPKEAQFKQVLKQARQVKAAPMVESAIKKQTTEGAIDLPGAIADYEAALRIDDDANTHLNLGTAYQQANNLPRALENYKRAINMDKTLVNAYYYMGTVYEGMKQPALAGAEYKKYLQIAPTGESAAACKDRLKILNIK